MSHSFTCSIFHMVFATKGRRPMIPPAWKSEIRRYMAGILRNHRSRLITAGGMPDHLHVLASLHAQLCVSEAVRVLKANTSRWLSRQKGVHRFAWQEGYAGFSVSRSQVERVRTYINHQEQHHRRRSFEEEIRQLLEDHDMKSLEGWE
jgi:REP element-mobilizing transposase RayT